MNQFGVMVGVDKKDSFEGWFCKIDDKKNNLLFSVIWGYSTHATTRHAFIQFQNGLSHSTEYISFPIEELLFEQDPFTLHIGNNMLSLHHMKLDLCIKGEVVRGMFTFQRLTPIKQSFLKPNIMGILTYLPNECNHSIVSMDHKVSGWLQLGEQSFLIENAKGYMEKDWGTGFPKEYVWVQANDFSESSVVFSYATIPVLGRFAKGFLVVLIHQGQEYRFTSVEGGRIHNFQVGKDYFSCDLKKGDMLIHLAAKQLNPVELASPVHGEMKNYIKESLDGEMMIRVYKKGNVIIELSTTRASIDVHFIVD